MADQSLPVDDPPKAPHHEATTRQSDIPPRYGTIARGPRRRQLQNAYLLYTQILRGRPNPLWTWCGRTPCLDEAHLFCRSSLFLLRNSRAANDIPVDVYFSQFGETTSKLLFPDIESMEAVMAKNVAIQALATSPPVVAAFWRLTYGMKRWQTDFTQQSLWSMIVEARSTLGNFVSEADSAKKIQFVHMYLGPTLEQMTENWTQLDYVLQFLLSAELWREYGSRLWPDWNFGSVERNVELLSALLLHLCYMYRDGCFTIEYFMDEERWNEVWTQWFNEVALTTRQPDLTDLEMKSFVPRHGFPEDERDFLTRVGYLGITRTYIESMTAASSSGRNKPSS